MKTSVREAVKNVIMQAVSLPPFSHAVTAAKAFSVEQDGPTVSGMSQRTFNAFPKYLRESAADAVKSTGRSNDYVGP